MKISTKLLLIIILATTLIGATALLGVVATANLLEDQTKEKYIALSTYAIEKVHRLFTRRAEDIARFARDRVIASRSSSPRQKSEKLKNYLQHAGSYLPFASISFFDLQGRRIAGTEGNADGAQSPFPAYRAGFMQGRSFLLEASRSEPSGVSAFHFAQAVKDGSGAPFGVIVADLPVESLQEIVRRPLGLFKVGSQFAVDLIDANGRILFSSYNKEGVLREISQIFPVVQQASAENGATGTVLLPDPSGKNDRTIVVFAREAGDATSPGRDWTLVISLPERAALAPLMALKNRLAWVFIAVGSIAAGIVLMLSRTITRPLARLSSALAEVGQGNLDVVVKVSSRDETGRLSAVFNSMVGELKHLHGQLHEAASVDSLTGALNRKKIDEILRSEVERSQRYNGPLSLILFDLDHFKSINDTHGHLSGDDILRTLTGVIKDNIRRTDYLGRWGGEEFLLLTPGTTLEQAAELADKLRKRIEAFRFPVVGSVTVSCGVAAFRDNDTGNDLIKRADDALYRAKDRGRNLVEVFG
ncbi:MAG: diguanylate cyclase [Nitrospiraceae bacterium]|nr:diguanylate cyclase [Nitrospiraceae bacterium]